MDPTTEQQPVTPKRGPGIWVFAVIALVAIGGFVAWKVAFEPRGHQESPVADAGITPEVVDAGPGLSIDDGDVLLKKLGAGWSTDPAYSKWLDALVLRQLVAATQSVAEGSSPRLSLPFISIAGPFAVREESPPAPAKKKKKGPPPPPRDERLFISPESYARYDAIVATFGSIDAAAAGDAWAKLEPFCDVAFGEIARPGARFHDALTAAIKRMLSVKAPDGDVEVVAKGAIYLYKDPALEALSPAEKHLLRMGAKNSQIVQAQLRAFAAHAKLEVGP